MSSKTRVLVIDFMGSVYTPFHAKETNLPLSFTLNLREIVRTYKIDKTVLLLEGGSGFRQELLPTYKQARKERRAKYTEAEQNEYAKFLREVDELTVTLQLLGCTPLRFGGAEADDLAGYLCAILPPEQYQLLLLSEDSDWSQLLVRPNTVQGSYKAMTKSMPELPNDLWLSYARFTETKGLTPEQWFEKKMLTGDTSDSIPGIAGLGDTGATRLLEKYDSLSGIIANNNNLDIPRLKQQAKSQKAS